MKHKVIAALLAGVVAFPAMAYETTFDWNEDLGIQAYNVKVKLTGLKVKNQTSGRYTLNGETSGTNKYAGMAQTISGIYIAGEDTLYDGNFYELGKGYYEEWDDDVEFCMMTYFDKYEEVVPTNGLASAAGKGFVTINMKLGEELYIDSSYVTDIKVKASLKGAFKGTLEQIDCGTETNAVLCMKTVAVGRGRGNICDGDGSSEDVHGPLHEEFMYPNQKVVIKSVVVASNVKLSESMTDAFVSGYSTNENLSAAQEAAGDVLADYISGKIKEEVDAADLDINWRNF